jgi:DNA-damage-inducible protein J
MAESCLSIWLDSDLREEAARVVERYGLDLPTVTRVFITQIANTNTIPLSLDYGRRDDVVLDAARESEQWGMRVRVRVAQSEAVSFRAPEVLEVSEVPEEPEEPEEPEVLKVPAGAEMHYIGGEV